MWLWVVGLLWDWFVFQFGVWLACWFTIIFFCRNTTLRCRRNSAGLCCAKKQLCSCQFVSRSRIAEWINEYLLKDRSTVALVGVRFRMSTASCDSWIEPKIPFHQLVGQTFVTDYQTNIFPNESSFDLKSANWNQLDLGMGMQQQYL